MRLCDAIREGAKKRPQAFEEYFDEDNTELSEEAEPTLCSCALGAAFEGVNVGPGVECNSGTLRKLFPVLKRDGVECPVEVCEERFADAPLINVVAHLNDYHRWQREEIADWVEQFET